MDWGVIAFIDALAVKGIWRRHDADAVLDAFESMKMLALDLKSKVDESFGGDLWEKLTAHVAFFSDSVAIAITLPPPLYESEDPQFYESVRKYMLLRHVVQFLSRLVGDAVIGDVSLMYRGCISVGNLAVRGESFIGEAVDTAGAQFESCEGAFVFLTSDAAKVFTERHPYLKLGHPPYFVPYRVPMKNGYNMDTLTINPLLYLKGESKQQAIDAFVRELGDPEKQPEPIRVKVINTLKYLQYLQGWQW
jgi:hypothetical protein